MPIISVEIHAHYCDSEKICLENGKIVEWKRLTPLAPPKIPYGTNVQITISYEQRDYLNGEDCRVWASYDQNQAETIQSALKAQKIAAYLDEEFLIGRQLYVVFVSRKEDVEAAIDFIWRDPTGMRLHPDWWYPEDARNESFRKWTNGS